MPYIINKINTVGSVQNINTETKVANTLRIECDVIFDNVKSSCDAQRLCKKINKHNEFKLSPISYTYYGVIFGARLLPPHVRFVPSQHYIFTISTNKRSMRKWASELKYNFKEYNDLNIGIINVNMDLLAIKNHYTIL